MTFNYTIDGDSLSLTPVLTQEMKAEAERTRSTSPPPDGRS